MDDCEQHKVYWLKRSSGECLSRIIDGNKDAHFVMAATQTCVYNFTMRILTLSDTGTYYCAMDVDGEIIIGHGTKLTIVVSGNIQSIDFIIMFMNVKLVLLKHNHVQYLLCR